ncbi:short-chain fatty acid transporter [Pseudogracilibacillus auburnensis]|uniref:Short-chain fatty acids transporter n=1 Tax=Pseudogracilibacillus auburnensis TaxID=1494959 RepID=A0A2V3W7S7_9BACI|nr:TIGR00366 family protein [Pseudogracilibacillus auburnensis]MBO1001948.1 short-chain fatty acid transporter [Pseudogracilibacillus auburnensis]PXW90172.1 short-chain fatty acids transporter [Pseudogracilibacillus auburnensis]
MKKLANFFNSLVQKYLPDPFVFAVILLVIVLLSAFIWTPTSPGEMIDHFGDGFWSLLAFTMQLSIVLITSSAIANTRFIKKYLAKLASIPKNPTQAVFTVAIVTSLVGIINWGIALVVGIIYAKEVAKQVKGTHYPLLIAASYIGFTVWSSGLSSSIPLTLNTPDHPVEGINGIIPLTETIFTLHNLIIGLALILTYALVSRMLTPKEHEIIAIDSNKLIEDDNSSDFEQKVDLKGKSLAFKLEHNRIISSIAGIVCLLFFAKAIITGGVNAINLNTINMFTIGLGLLMYSGVKPYLEAAGGSIKSVTPLIILYPFYGAIQTMLAGSGLGEIVSNYFASIATAETLPILTYLAAGFLNLFVPAAGGQIIIQGPIFLPIAEQLGVPQGLIAMAITYGDTWTNLLQPFWALPALALAGLGVRDIMGYCITAMLVSGVVTGVLLTILPIIL